MIDKQQRSDCVMKRIILVYLLIVLCICGLCGCGGTENEPQQNQSTESQMQNEETSKQEETMEQKDAETAEAPAPVTHTIYDGTTVELSKAKVGDVVLFGAYEQDNITSNGVETIPWYVLDKDGDDLLLMSVYLLDCVQYHKVSTSITWENCTLRQWMNDDFYNSAFTASEKKYIRTSYLENADNPWYGIEGGNDTEDKVFALSLAEAKQYFEIEDKPGRSNFWESALPTLSAAKVTAYAEAQGALVSDKYYESTAGNGLWWLRSPGSYNDFAALIDYYGNGLVDGYYAYFYNYAARPALWLNLNP